MPKLTGALLHEQLLLRMDEKEWESFKAPVLRRDEPVVTGDPIIDEWERKLQDGSLDLERI